MVRLELWNGARGKREKKVPRTAGVTVPSTDVLIYACATHHGAEIEHSDSDFAAISDVPR